MAAQPAPTSSSDPNLYFHRSGVVLILPPAPTPAALNTDILDILEVGGLPRHRYVAPEISNTTHRVTALREELTGSKAAIPQAAGAPDDVT